MLFRLRNRFLIARIIHSTLIKILANRKRYRNSQQNSCSREKGVIPSKETDIEERANLRLVIESIRRIVEISANIAEIVLNMTVEMVLE